ETYETGNSRDEPGSYGMIIHGRRIKGRSLRSVNNTTRGRHALYIVGHSDECFVDSIYGEGFDLAAFQIRVSEQGGGRHNGYGRAEFIDCNTGSDTAAPQAVVNCVVAGSAVRPTAGNARIGETI